MLEVVEVDEEQREPVGAVGGLEALRALLEEGTPVPEAGELVGHGLAMRVGQALDLPEADERPRRGEEQRERGERHDRGGQLAEGGDDEHDDRGQRGQHRDGEDRLRASGLDLPGRLRPPQR